MKIDYNWLKDYIDVKKTPAELAELLIFHVAEVEGVEQAGQLDGIVVGKVLEVTKHPDADKLSLAKVNVGGESELEIVCGAPNLEKDQLVPVALVGAVLPGDFKIEEREVRGKLSQGMICAEDELGLDENHDGIIVLDETYNIGDKFVPKNSGDSESAIIDVSVPANRPDLMSHEGVAREIAAVLGENWLDKDEPIPKADSEVLSVEVEDNNLCPRYSALVISGIEIGSSPDWMRKRLEALGLRPINNIVDLTNYIMLDLGQPMHAFDLDKISGQKMIVREAKQDEEVQTLDDQTWKLEAGMPVIQDAEKIIDLAGIMGGKNSEVDESTKTIILQAAKFDGITIRKASRALGHRTDAVGVYEKGIDQNLSQHALGKAWKILSEMNSGVKVEQVVDIEEKQNLPVTIKLDPKKVSKLLGLEVSKEEIVKLLKFLKMEVSGEEVLEVRVPTYRSDVKIAEDLIEDVARMIGFDKIPVTMPEGDLITPETNQSDKWGRIAKRALLAGGFNEVYNYSFTSKEAIENLGMNLEGHLKVANPISPENSYLRASLIPNLLLNVKDNLKNYSEFSLFELGHVYFGHDATDSVKYEEAITEKERLSGVMVNTDPRKSNGKVRSESFLKTKGIVEELLSHLGFEEAQLEFKQLDIPNATFHPGRTAVIKVKLSSEAKLDNPEEEIGFVGEVHPAMLDAYGIEAVVGVFDLDFEKLVQFSSHKKEIDVVGKFPGVTRDVAFAVDKNVQVGELKAVMGYAGGELIEKVDLFDTYEGDQIDEDKKSLAFHVLYQMPDRTLIDKEVDIQHRQVVNAVKERYGADLRA